MSVISKVIKTMQPYMRANGYRKKGNCFYRITDEFALCVDFECPSGLLYSHYFIIPLYIQTEYRYLTYGNRMDAIDPFDLPSINETATDKDIAEWTDVCISLLEDTVFPFFNRVSTPKSLLSLLVDEESDEINKYFFCSPIDRLWLKVFTTLYCNDVSKAMELITKYKEELAKCTFLAPSVIFNRLLTISQIEGLMNNSVANMDSYFSEVIENTRKCFF